MGLKSIKILGIPVTTDSKKNILEYIEKYLGNSSEKRKKPMVIVTPNPEQIVAAQEDSHFAKILNQADVALPDGIGLALATGQRRIPGVEFMEDLIRLASVRGYPIGLIGGRGGVAVEALECLSRHTPGLRGWTFDPGDVDLGDLGDLHEKIRSTNTKIVFVGLGAPKQEYFIEAISKKSSVVSRSLGKTRDRQSSDRLKVESWELKTPLVLMSVGGAFDIISGRTPRAPHVIQAIYLEWLWRLVREPWRWRRQLDLLKFIWLVLGEKLASQGLALRS